MTLPPKIGQLTQLRELRLSNTNLTSLPPEIGQLKQLQVLHLGETPLRSLPLQLGHLSQLKTLYVGYTSLTFPPPEIVAQGTPAILAYLRDYEAMLMRQTIAGIAAGVGGIVTVMLAFRWRQRRGLHDKKKRT